MRPTRGSEGPEDSSMWYRLGFSNYHPILFYPISPHFHQIFILFSIQLFFTHYLFRFLKTYSQYLDSFVLFNCPPQPFFFYLQIQHATLSVFFISHLTHYIIFTYPHSFYFSYIDSFILKSLPTSSVIFLTVFDYPPPYSFYCFFFFLFYVCLACFIFYFVLLAFFFFLFLFTYYFTNTIYIYNTTTQYNQNK